MKITEGLRPLDLEKQVRSLISVDEYESKISDNSVVLAFFCASKHASEDLVRFIHKSSVDLLDVDMSSAPDMNGRYLVFVELPNIPQLGDSMSIILRELEAITGIDLWDFRYKGKIIKVDKDTVRAAVALISASTVISKLGAPIPGTVLESVVDYGAISSLCEKYSLGLDVDSSYEAMAVVENMKRDLPQSIEVVATGRGVLLINERTGFAALIR